MRTPTETIYTEKELELISLLENNDTPIHYKQTHPAIFMSLKKRGYPIERITNNNQSYYILKNKKYADIKWHSKMVE